MRSSGQNLKRQSVFGGNTGRPHTSTFSHRLALFLLKGGMLITKGRLTCEQCGRLHSMHMDSASELKGVMRSACKVDNWGYQWTHFDGGEPIGGEPATAHFYCPKCKSEFDCVVDGGSKK